jgi:uncharacterized protein YaaQ
MKLIICILQDSDKDEVSKALTENSWRVTQLPSTGAYFRRDSTTINRRLFQAGKCNTIDRSRR